jgi:hypothetical protein
MAAAIMEDTTGTVIITGAIITHIGIPHFIGDFRYWDGPMPGLMPTPPMGVGLTIPRKQLSPLRPTANRRNSRPTVGITARILKGTTPTLKVARAAG